MNINYLSPIGANQAANIIKEIFTNPDISFFERGKGAKLESLVRKQDAWRSLNIRFLALKEAAERVAEDSAWVLRDPRVYASTFTAAVNDGARPGTYAVEVQQLARYHRVSSDAQANAYTALGLAGTVLIDGVEVEISAADTLEDIGRWIAVMNNATVTSNQQAAGFVSSGGTIQINDQDITIPAGTTLAGIRDLINQKTAVTGAAATVMDNRLFLADITGNQGTVTAGDVSGQAMTELGMLEQVNTLDQAYHNDVHVVINDSKLVICRTNSTDTIRLRGDTAIWKALGFFDVNNDLKNEVVSPQNARFTINDRHYEKKSNTVSDVLENVVITLKNTSNYANNLIIRENEDIPRQAIENFVEQYNYAVEELNQGLAENGVFRADQMVWEIRNTMLENITNAIDDLISSMNEAEEAGLDMVQPSLAVIDDLRDIRSEAETDRGTLTSQDNNESLMKLSTVGIIFNQGQGTLSIDYDTLNAALASEPARVKALFTNEADNLARRFGDHMESLVNPVTGQVSTQIRVADLLIEEVEKDGTEQARAESEFTRRKLDYLSLLTVKNTMARQKGTLATSIF